ncbi:MAG: germination protein YpeB [Alicyclobacillus sp.]|nr:germination protein YpeB [Alicyclobacillus sp.]
MHRTTWVALPVLGLVVVGTGLGWWGYDQQRQRQAMALQAGNQYAAAFHGLVNDLQNMHQVLGKSTVTADPISFQYCLRNVWRLSDAAQTELTRLPVRLMPDQKTKLFLSTVASDMNDFLIGAASPKDPEVEKQLTQLYKQSGIVTNRMTKLQASLLNHGSDWLAYQAHGPSTKAAASVEDGFRQADHAASAFVETKLHVASLHRGATDALQAQPTVTGTQAKRIFQRFIGSGAQWQVHRAGGQGGDAVYSIDGVANYGRVGGHVSIHGGHVLSFTIERTPSNASDDLAKAEQNARRWLQGKGFGKVELVTSNQYDHAGYFVYTPVRQNRSVPGQSISVKVALDNGQVIGYDANNYYHYPVATVPGVRYSDAALRKRLNPSLHVRQVKDLLILDRQDHYQPATAFYGTANGETYCVYMNAHTGKEMDIEQLTDQTIE